jgi:hypothetical protein
MYCHNAVQIIIIITTTTTTTTLPPFLKEVLVGLPKI